MLVIGLTGGIGSGKTTVSKILQDMGAVVLDADRVGHEAYNPGTQTWRDVVAAFGEDIVQDNGEIDRRKLGSIVFNDAPAMKKLTDIMWPRIYGIVKERTEEQKKSGTEVMVVEAAVLVEANWTPLVDDVWVITASEDAVVKRLKESKGMTEEQVRSRIDAQMCSDERLSRADVVIYNDSGLGQLKQQLVDAWKSRVERKR